MARILTLGTDVERIQTSLARSFQSGHINFLIGSGASRPAIPVAGTVEQNIAKLFEEGRDSEANDTMYEFLAAIQTPTNDLVRDRPNDGNSKSVDQYSEFLQILEIILTERRTDLLPKQATVFSTNYDLLIEKAALQSPSLRLNDGFSRVPSLDGRMEFSSRTFYTSTSNTGNLYNYKVEIPCVNLIKLHGSLSWERQSDTVLFAVREKPLLPSTRTETDTRSFVESYAVVLPQTTKYRTTLLDSTYYELLRIYSNELDREGTLLIAFGFSFGDEHILSITKRALRNPTLRLVVGAFNAEAAVQIASRFAGYSNVEVLSPDADGVLDFPTFNRMMRACIPVIGGKR